MLLRTVGMGIGGPPSGSGAGRQVHRERAALAGQALQRDLAAQQAHQLAADRKAQSRAAEFAAGRRLFGSRVVGLALSSEAWAVRGGGCDRAGGCAYGHSSVFTNLPLIL